MKFIPAFFIAGTCVLGACASVPASSTQAIAEAEATLKVAQKPVVRTYAAPELVVADQRLDGSRQAVRKSEAQLAELLAYEAELSADLAIAKADAGESNVANLDIKRARGIAQ